MKKWVSIISLVSCLILVSGVWAADSVEHDAGKVIARYFDALGGMDKILAVNTVTATARMDAFDFQYDLFLLADGRFKTVEDKRSTGFDGKMYWQDNYGMVEPLDEAAIERYKDSTLRGIFFQDLIDPAGTVKSLKFLKEETKHGKSWMILSDLDENGFGKLYFFNSENGLLEKIVNIVDSEDVGMEKTVEMYSNYTQIGNVKLFMNMEITSIADGRRIIPPLEFKDIKINEITDLKIFDKPVSTVEKASVTDGVASCKIIGVSGRGSLIVNVTKDVLDAITVKNGEAFDAVIKEKTFRITYYDDIADAASLESGDQLALFNDTPTLWLVKAYVGFTSEGEFVTGDTVTIKKAE